MIAYEQLLHLTVPKLVQRGSGRTPGNVLRESLRKLVSRSWSCRHRQMSRPFTRDGETHRVCLQCGMLRKFDLETWEMKGRYYQDKTMMRLPGTKSTQIGGASRAPKLRLIA